MSNQFRLFLSLLLLFASSVASAQTTLPMQFTGTISEWLTFDGLQKPTGRLTSQVNSLKSSATTTHVTLHQQLFDAMDVPVLDYDLPARVMNSGPVLLDVRAFMSAHLVRALRLKELMAETDSLATLPTLTARAGDLLPETHLALGNGSGPTPRGVDISSLGRWIEERETIATPAGTFACFRLNQNLQINTFTTGERRSYEARVVAWYAPEVGLVKMATYVGSKLLDTTVLNRMMPPAATEPATAELNR